MHQEHEVVISSGILPKALADTTHAISRLVGGRLPQVSDPIAVNHHEYGAGIGEACNVALDRTAHVCDALLGMGLNQVSQLISPAVQLVVYAGQQ